MLIYCITFGLMKKMIICTKMVMVTCFIDLNIKLKSKYNYFYINDNLIQRIRSTRMSKHENDNYPNLTCGFFKIL